MSRNWWSVATLGALVTIELVGFALMQRFLSDWWFRTDACPDPAVACGQPAPVMLPFAVFTVVAVIVFSLFQKRGDADQDH